MMKKKITVKEVAKLSGVSITTVSLILDENAKKFSPKTARKVLAVKEELGCQPDCFARQMITKETRMTGILVPDITNPFFSTLIRGAEDILYNQSFAVILCDADSDHQKETEYLAELTYRGVDEFTIATSAVSTDAINENPKKQGRPFTVLGQKKSEGFNDAVRTDGFRDGYLTGMHLLSLGHRTVALVYPGDLPENVHARIDGFKPALDVHQIPRDRLVLLPTQFSKQDGYQVTAKLLDSAVTGVFTLNDELAFRLHRELEEIGRSTLEDYNTIGYDNIDMYEYIRLKLTTIV